MIAAAILSAMLHASPFGWPVPDRWRRETFAFPLDFAPELHHTGLEEVRFSPGMFEPGRADFFTYAFVWWLDGKQAWTPASLERELATYFEGLARNVDPKGLAASRTLVHARLRVAPAAGARQAFAGTIDTYEPFATHTALRLHVRVRVLDCPGHTAALFEFSPNAPGTRPWKRLEEVARQFRCATGE